MNPRDGSKTDDRRTALFTVDRRTYLQGTTAAVVASAGIAGSGSVGAQSDYELVEAAGQTVHVNCGDTYENKLIDLTTGESFNISVQGGYSTIRNIGFRGLYRGSGFMITITAEDGPVLIENIYLGDGATKEGSDFVHGPGGVFYHAVSGADVTFRYCNVQGYPNNGFYCSNTPKGGTVTWENCFAKNNGVSSFRCGDPDDRIINCVAYNDDTDYGEGYGGYVEENGRPVWAWNPGGFTIENSHFAAGPYPYAMVAGANDEPADVNFVSGALSGEIHSPHGGTVTLGDDVGDEPDLSVPDGVPTSPEDAASGPTEGPAFDDAECPEHSDLPHIYEFVGGGDGPSDYYFEIEEGPIVPVVENGAIIDEEFHWISEDGARAAGRVQPDERHAYRFGTLIVDATIEGDAVAYVNGSESNLDRYPQDGAMGDDWKGGFPWQEGEDPAADVEEDVTEETEDEQETETEEAQETETEDEQETETEDDVAEGMPGFTVVVTLGALATTGAAMLRRFRNSEKEP